MNNCKYVSIVVTYYTRSKSHRHDCLMFVWADGKNTVHEVDYNSACKLIWKLVKAGGKREYRMNMFDSSISRVEVNHVVWQ